MPDDEGRGQLGRVFVTPHQEAVVEILASSWLDEGEEGKANISFLSCMYGCFFCMYVCVPRVCWVPVELQMIVCCHKGGWELN